MINAHVYKKIKCRNNLNKLTKQNGSELKSINKCKQKHISIDSIHDFINFHLRLLLHLAIIKSHKVFLPRRIRYGRLKQSFITKYTLHWS